MISSLMIYVLMFSALKAAQSSGSRRNTQSAQQLEEGKPMARPPSAGPGAQPGQQQQQPQAQQTPQQRQQQQQQVCHHLIALKFYFIYNYTKK